MVRWLQARNITVEGCGRGKQLTSRHPGSREQGTVQQLDIVLKATPSQHTQTNSEVYFAKFLGFSQANYNDKQD